jgi:hypothetical protein
VVLLSAAFSAVVSSPAWRADAEAWLRDAVASVGGRVTAVEQPRVRPWSTQLVVDGVTSDGATARWWFKADARCSRFEPALQALLARLVPDAVDAPVAVDPDRGWMLTADRGATLRDDHRPTTTDWAAVVAEWASVQRAAVTHARDVLATGVVDCSPATVPRRFDELLALLRGLDAGHPARLPEDVADRLDGARGRVAEVAELLLAGALPPSVQHGDLHPGNVFATPAGLHVFDLGDVTWAHPLEVLRLPAALVRGEGGAEPLDWAPVEAAYREAWGDDGRVPWAEQLRAATLTEAVNRAAGWWGALGEADDAELDTWGHAPGWHLARVLEA